MQVLQIKKRDQNNTEVTVGVKVLRCWHDGSGRSIYLHSTGVYGYKDGTPVRTRAELDMIGSDIHRELAIRWWKNTGQALSEKYYKELADAERARLDDFVINDQADATEMDQVLYRARPKTKKGEKKAEWGAAFAWMEKFEKRPDWWGQAERIELRGYEYEQCDDPVKMAGDLSPGEV